MARRRWLQISVWTVVFGGLAAVLHPGCARPAPTWLGGTNRDGHVPLGDGGGPEDGFVEADAWVPPKCTLDLAACRPVFPDTVVTIEGTYGNDPDVAELPDGSLVVTLWGSYQGRMGTPLIVVHPDGSVEKGSDVDGMNLVRIAFNMRLGRGLLVTDSAALWFDGHAHPVGDFQSIGNPDGVMQYAPNVAATADGFVIGVGLAGYTVGEPIPPLYGAVLGREPERVDLFEIAQSDWQWTVPAVAWDEATGDWFVAAVSWDDTRGGVWRVGRDGQVSAYREFPGGLPGQYVMVRSMAVWHSEPVVVWEPGERAPMLLIGQDETYPLDGPTFRSSEAVITQFGDILAMGTMDIDTGRISVYGVDPGRDGSILTGRYDVTAGDAAVNGWNLQVKATSQGLALVWLDDNQAVRTASLRCCREDQ